MNNPLKRTTYLFLTLMLAVFFFAVPIQAKRDDDVVILKNGDRLTGEIKGLQRGELRFKASYMAEAVRLDWRRVERLESKDRYQILLTSGQIYTDCLKLSPSNARVSENFIIGQDRNGVTVKQLDVVRIMPVEAKFFSQLEGSIDLGFSFNSGNDQYDTTFAAAAGYRSGNNSMTARVDSVFSGQSEGSRTARNEFLFDYRRQVSPKWYVGGLFDLLRSDQQSLDLRTTVAGFLGRNLKQTDRTRLSVFAGLAGTRENYSTVFGRPRTTNADALVGIDFANFRFTTTDIGSRFTVYPSLTTPGRMRMQVTSDMRIKIAKDFYWGFHVYENFDSKPPVRADKNDLGISTSLGWKF